MSHSIALLRLHALRVALLLCGWMQMSGCGQPPSPPDGEHAGNSGTQDSSNSCGASRQWDELQIEVTGSEFQWRYRYPGRDGKLGTGDDRLALRDLHLPVQSKTTMLLKSSDYLYTYAIPEFDKKEIAVPELTYTIEVVPSEIGRFEFRGDQFCGYSHSQLSGQVVVESPCDFNQWLDSLAPYAQSD